MDIRRLPNINEPINVAGLASFTSGDGAVDTMEIERNLVEREEDRAPEGLDDDIAAELKKRLAAVGSAVGFSLDEEVGEDDDLVNGGDEGDGDEGDGESQIPIYPEPIHHDRTLVGMSNEQRKQRVLMNALSAVNTQGLEEDEKFSLDAEKINDKKNMLLEQINMLRINLTDDGIKLDGVREVTGDNTFEEVESVYKQLRYRNDHVRYCGFATEIAQVAALGAEFIFDGQRDFFGYKPDLTGWAPTLNIKMRRLNYETSSLVGDVMRDYNMGNFARILFDVLPGAIVHMKMRSAKNKAIAAGKPSRADVNAAIGSIRNMDNRLGGGR